MESHRHTSGKPMPELRYLVMGVLNRHDIMSEECNMLSLGLDELGWDGH